MNTSIDRFITYPMGLNQLTYCITLLMQSEQVSFKKEVGVMVNDLVFWLTVCLILKMCY